MVILCAYYVLCVVVYNNWRMVNYTYQYSYHMYICAYLLLISSHVT